MAVTTSGAYLLLARYNRAKWNSLKKPAALAVGYGITPEPEPPRDEQDEAHEQAELLFPEDHHPVPQLTSDERASLPPLEKPDDRCRPIWKGVRMLHSFHSNMFAWLHEKIPDIDKHGTNRAVETPPAEGEVVPEKTPSQIVDEMMRASGTEYDDPGIGWLAVVDAERFPDLYRAYGRQGRAALAHVRHRDHPAQSGPDDLGCL